VDSNKSRYNDLIYYGMSVLNEKVYLILLEEQSNVRFSHGNLGPSTNPFEYAKVLVVIDAKNGELISMESVSNDEYASFYQSIYDEGGVFHEISSREPRL